jgi:GDP-4-dehydro-6-deoxy-D-mannose reductase
VIERPAFTSSPHHLITSSPPRRALVTGIGGFAAGHLSRLLLERGAEVTGTYRPGHPPARLAPSVRLLPAALEDGAALTAAAQAARPDQVFHLAGISSEAEARQQPERALAVNLLGTLHLFAALLTLDHRPRVLIAGSSAEYGLVRPEENPVGEAQPLRPASPYGVSKAAQGLLAFQYHAEHGLPVIRVRAFNHIGPGQQDGLAASSFARQIAEVEAGLRPAQIEVGNLSARRDLSDVRDVVRAYLALAESGLLGEVYNVGSGQAIAISAVLEHLLTLSPTPIQVTVSPDRLRSVDVPLLVADTTRLRDATGWEPQIPLEQSLAELLESWRERVGASGAGRGP